MPNKPIPNEEAFFLREESLKRQKAALEQQRLLLEKEKKELREAHWMKCPKCGMDLQAVVCEGVELDRCYSCSGTWFDAGEMEKLGVSATGNPVEKDSVLGAILGIFSSK